jgi:Fe-S cluster assembly protein SufD
MSAATTVPEASTRFGRLINERLAARHGDGPSWLHLRREAAATRFAAIGLPSSRDEAWRYTPLQGLLSREIGSSVPDAGAPDPAEVGAVLLQQTRVCRLAFVDGRFAPHLSRLIPLGAGTRAGSLREALRDAPAETLPDAGELHAFAAMNTALFEDGGRIHVPAGHGVDVVVELLFLASGRGDGAMHHPRNLITLGAGASATVIERYAGLGSSQHLTNAVTDIVLGAGAHLSHLRVQEEDAGAFHMGSVRVRQERDSRYAGFAASLGGAWSRCEHHADFAAAGASFAVDGLYLAGDRQFVDHHLDIRHAVPGCASRETFKGLLHGAGRAVFDGRIVVERDAQKTDAALDNANLLLSRNAEVDTKPQLEIWADDVKCSHGAAVGQIDPAQLFYLRARGVPEAQAREMLCLGFAQEVLDACPVPELRARLEQAVAQRIRVPC